MRALPLLLLVAGCVEKPLDGAPGGPLANSVSGYAPGQGWDARVEAFDASRASFAVVPLYDENGRAVPTLRSADEPATESALMTPRNDRDLLYRYTGFYDLPPWAWRYGRATVRVVLRAPRTTAFTPAFAYSSAAYHGCVEARAETTSDLHDLGAACADRRALTILRAGD